MKEPLNQLIDILPGSPPPIFNLSIEATTLLVVLLIIICGLYYLRAEIQQKYKLFKILNRLNAQSDESFIPSVNIFLKDVADLYFPRDDFASLHTAEWLHYLDSVTKTNFTQFNLEWEIWSYANKHPTKEQKKLILKQCKNYLRHIHRKKIS